MTCDIRLVAFIWSISMCASIVRCEPQGESTAAQNSVQRDLGDPSAPVVITAFFDFDCRGCASTWGEVLAAIRTRQPLVRVTLRTFATATDRLAIEKHEAVLSASSQGKLWEMFQTLLQNPQSRTRADLIALARNVGIDVPQFDKLLDDHHLRRIVQDDIAEAVSLGITVAPTLVINGVRLVGPQPQTSIDAVIEVALSRVGQERLNKSDSRVSISVEGSPRQGPLEAPVQLVEFADFGCGACSALAQAIRRLVDAYPGKVALIFKHYPLPIHANALLAHKAAAAAQAQSKFWEMHDMLFASKRPLTREAVIQNAKSLGLRVPRFERDLDSIEVSSVIEADQLEGRALGVDGTPTFFVNGRIVPEGASLGDLRSMIASEIKTDR